MDSIKRGIDHYYHSQSSSDVSQPLTTTFVVFLSVAFTVAYVLPFYLFEITRPSPTIHRDSPTVIKGRVRLVILSCTLCTLATIFIITNHARKTRPEVFHLLGWYPLRLQDVFKPLFLTMILFAGPLYEKVIVEAGWRRYVTWEPLQETMSSWTGWRNYVAGPISEEVMFRSLLTSLSLLSSSTPKQSMFITPLYFGVAHIHHFYEFRLVHPGVPISGAILTSLFQFTYTTLFGWYANFVFIRTGSLYSVILIHSFCNWMGFPRLWGKVEAGVPIGPPSVSTSDTSKGSAYRPPFQEKSLHVMWTIVYYILLVGGLMEFRSKFWTLTTSTNGLGDL